MYPIPRLFLILCATVSLVTSAGCVKKAAIRAAASALSSSTGGFATDDDPELVGDALPFALKTIESLIVQVPEHQGLLAAAAGGFTQYGKAYVEYEADYIEDEDFERSQALRARAKKLYVRALGYGIQGLEVEVDDFRAKLQKDPEGTLAQIKDPKLASLLYWTAAAWGSAIAIAKDDASLSADLHLTAALMKRVTELDPDFGGGSAYDFFIAYDASRPAAAGGSIERARKHLEKSLELSHGQRAAPLVIFAETASVAEQDRDEFEKLLERALSIDVDRAPEYRLANTIAQERARWLLGRTDELFLE